MEKLKNFTLTMNGQEIYVDANDGVSYWSWHHDAKAYFTWAGAQAWVFHHILDCDGISLPNLIEALGREGKTVTITHDPKRGERCYSVKIDKYGIGYGDDPLEMICDYLYETRAK